MRSDPRSSSASPTRACSVLEFNVSDIAFDPPVSTHLDLSQLRFFLSTLDAWVHVLRQLQLLDVTCTL